MQPGVQPTIEEPREGVTGGKLTVVGLGPGGPSQRTPQATEALARATDLVGYEPYLDLVGPLAAHQTRHASDNRQESARSRFALDLAASGRVVAVVSSGDPGVFAMATAVLEELHLGLVRGEHERGEQERGEREPRGPSSAAWGGVRVAIVPGLTASSAAAALLGAPLGHDFCVISMSDVLKPWPVVELRLAAVAAADFVIALYNPISRHRPWQLGRGIDIVRAHRAPQTPVALARAVGRPGETLRIVALRDFDPADVDMSTVVIIGSSTTRTFTDGLGHPWMYTPRTYPSPAPW